ncbi:MAG: hypothetical protein NTZ10_06155 [Candidatus Saganbacteria bacterium]|nr:hypothetical protein [Candidatus Saganbacteria bacterium]
MEIKKEELIKIAKEKGIPETIKMLAENKITINITIKEMLDCFLTNANK